VKTIHYAFGAALGLVVGMTCAAAEPAAEGLRASQEGGALLVSRGSLPTAQDNTMQKAQRTALAHDTTEQTPAQRLIGDFSPKLVELTDKVLFGDVWARPGLSPRDRSLVTVSALIALNRPDQLRSHLVRARQNGLTEQEVVETITHLAFYAGWPNAITAIGVAKEVFEK
jgi:4-carboxymuconolactone decarboxylase